MIKALVNKVLNAALREIFIDAGSDTVKMSMGADLFSDSNIHLQNLTFRPDLFDTVFQPFRLVSGHLGRLSVDGIAEFALGGNVRIQVENVFLLFAVDTHADAEYAQFLKKILVELQSSKIEHQLIRELLKKIQGFPTGKDPDFKKKRAVMLKMMTYAFRNFQVILKTVHIRLEMPDKVVLKVPASSSSNSASTGSAPTPTVLLCSAVGIALPQLKMGPNTNLAVRPDNVNKDDPVLNVSFKNLQIYCDYDCESYCPKGSTSASVLQNFISRWKGEVHTAMLFPFDLEVGVAAEVRKRTGLCMPKIAVQMPGIRIAVDPRQFEVLRNILEAAVVSVKRSGHLSKLADTFKRPSQAAHANNAKATSHITQTSDQQPLCVPRVFGIGGVHILPFLVTGDASHVRDTSAPNSETPAPPSRGFPGVVLRYPSGLPIPRLGAGATVVNTLKMCTGYIKVNAASLMGRRWARLLWQHAIRLVIDDIRAVRPMGRWIQLAKLIHIRKEYAFTYSKLIKRSRESGNFVYNVNAKVGSSAIERLFHYEMELSGKSIQIFRTLANMIAIVELFNGKKRQVQQSSRGSIGSSGTLHAFEKICISWKDILLIQTELLLAQEESAFTRFSAAAGSPSPDRKQAVRERPPGQASGTVDDDLDDLDGSVVDNDDAASVFSSSSSLFSSLSRGVSGVSKAPAAIASASVGAVARVTGGNDSARVGGSFHLFGSTRPPAPATLSILGVSSGSGAAAPPSSMFGQTARGVSSMGGSILKAMAAGPSFASLDDLDSKIFGKSEASAFRDIFSSEPEERAMDVSGGGGGAPRTFLTGASVAGVPPPATEEIILDVFDWQTSGASPTRQGVIEAIRATLLRHQAPLTLMPPDIKISIGKMEISLRSSVKEGKRKNIVGASVEQIAATLHISNTMGDAPSPSLSSNLPTSATANVAAATSGGGGLFGLMGSRAHNSEASKPALQIRALKGGFASLAGSLIQLRLTVLNAAARLYVHNTEVAQVMDGLPDHPDSDDEADVAAFEGEEDDEDVDTQILKNASVVGTSGDTILQSMARANLAKKAFVEGRRQRRREKKQETPVVDLFVSRSGSQNFLTACLMLDFDEKSEGAADLQVQLGDIAIDLGSGPVLSVMMDPFTADCLSRSAAVLEDLYRIEAIHSSKLCVVDFAAGLPAVILSGSLASSSHPHHSQLNLASIAQPAMPRRQQDGDEEDNEADLSPIDIDGGVDVDDRKNEDDNNNMAWSPATPRSSLRQTSDGDDAGGFFHHPFTVSKSPGARLRAATLSSTPWPGISAAALSRRRAVLNNLNYESWLEIVKGLLPRFLTVCVRTSTVSVNLLVEMTLRHFIQSLVHTIAEKASFRGFKSGLGSRDEGSMVLELLVGCLYNARHLNGRELNLRGGTGVGFPETLSTAGTYSSGGNNDRKSHPAGWVDPATLASSHATFPGVELLLLKQAAPAPKLELKMFGIELKLPISDDTLSHLSALLLTHVCPLHR